MSIKQKHINDTYPDLASRDAIPLDDRFDGMKVSVLDCGTGNYCFFQLQGGVANANWTDLLGGGGDETPSSIKIKYESNANTNEFSDAEKTKLSDTSVFTGTEKTKLSGIEDNATTDQTATEIEGLYEGINDTNKFTDAEKIKLSNITNSYKGYFPTEAALILAHPTGVEGDNADVGATSTKWAWSVGGGAWIDTLTGSSGDMLKSTYDPTSKNADAFDMLNMSETATRKILTDTERNKLGTIDDSAQVNVQSDWDSVSGDDFIKNKPVIPTVPTQLTDLDTTVTGSQLDSMYEHYKLLIKRDFSSF